MREILCVGCGRPVHGGRAWQALAEDREPRCLRCVQSADRRVAALCKRLFRAEFTPPRKRA